MSKVYLDNASTTAIHPQVIDEMVQIMSNDYGNPSSTHGFGRSAKSILELSRKSIAKMFSQEIILLLREPSLIIDFARSAVVEKVKRIITSKIEHHAVLETVLTLQKSLIYR
jgi:cysteine desulfurase